MKNVGSIAKASIPAVGTASFDTSAFKVAKFTPAVLDSTKKLTSTFKYVDTINGLNKKTFNNLKGVGAMSEVNKIKDIHPTLANKFNMATIQHFGNTFQFQGSFLVALFFVILKSSKLTPNASAILQIVSK